MPERIDPRKSLDPKRVRAQAAAEREARQGTQQTDGEVIAEKCVELEGELAELQAKYEQYFLGVERRPPTELHDRIKKAINGLRQASVRQTAAKFRVQSLHNKLLTYERLWARTLQEIEAGTYRKHLFRARLHHKPDDAEQKKAEQKKAEAPNPLAAPAPGVNASGVTVPITGERAVQPPPPPAGARPPPTPVSAQAGALSDAKMKAIFDAYVMAKKRCNEDTSKLSFESVSATLKSQVPALMKQHNAKSVEFKVVIKDGKAVLRALPKE